jgi:Tfp pilus assembly protein PilX
VVFFVPSFGGEQMTRKWQVDRRFRRDDAGFGLIEVVISMALLALIVVPITHLVITTEGSSNALHLRAEASDLATQALETAEYQTANGVNPTAGITTSTQHSGQDPFSVSVDWELAAGTGTSSSVCIAPPGQLSSRIWTVKATVSWGNSGGQKGHVVATTLVSPSLADLADTNAAEIAVPVFSADDSTLEITQPISITVVGSCAGSQCSGETVPSNENTTETANTGSSGCAVFPDLFAGAGWTYNISASPGAGYVDPNELFYNAASGVLIWSNVSVQANQVTVVSNPHLILALGATMTVNFQTVPFAVTGVSTATGSPSVTVVSGGFPGVAARMGVSGSGIASGTTVMSIAGNTLTLSANATATASGTVTLTFSGSAGVAPASYLPISVQSSTLLCSTLGAETCVLGNGTAPEGFSSTSPLQTALLYPGPATNPNYSAWAGDQADSEPSAYGAVATSLQALSGTTGTLQLPVYSVKLTVTSGSVTSFTASDYGGGDTLALNGISGTFATGLPLGQFQIQAANGNTNEPVTLQGSSSSGLYVWVTPTGVCASQTPLTSPCVQSSMTTSAISVSVA